MNRNIKEDICYYLLVSCLIGMTCNSCKQDSATAVYHSVSGETMGTTYECKFSAEPKYDIYKPQIDSLLELINAVASTYIPNSEVSLFNQAETSHCTDEDSPKSFHLRALMEISASVNKNSDGYFDPTMMPLVNYWGFGYEKRDEKLFVDTNAINDMMSYIGYNKVAVENQNDKYCLTKSHQLTQLDFSAVAKGYAVDMIATYLSQYGIDDYYINIGGEVVVKGHSPKEKPWTLGINYPDTTAQLNEIYAFVELTHGSMATSGNYRNFYQKGAQAFAHTINPKTGMAVPSDLLSATVLAENCALADAYATAFMAMGFERAQAKLKKLDEVEAFFIYYDDKKEMLHHYTSTNLKSKLRIAK